MIQVPYAIVGREEALRWARLGAGSFLHVLGDDAREVQREALGSRLGIPVLFGIDAVHGHALNDRATIFPSQLAVACSWDPALVEEMGRVTALAGAGTIDAVGLQGVAAIDVSDDSGLTVTGACAFSDRVTVTLPALADVKCPVGDYPVVTAAAFENLDLSKWSFAGTLHSSRCFAGFERRGDTIYAKIGGFGMMMLVR